MAGERFAVFNPTTGNLDVIADGDTVQVTTIDLTANLTVAGYIGKKIAQALHGFVVGNVLKFAGGVYAKAQADTAANAEVVGMVSEIVDGGNFIISTGGYIAGLSGLTANTVYYLSPSSAGAITATEPSTAGQISKPVFFAVSTAAGYFINYRGVSVNSSTSYIKSFVNGDLVAGVLTVAHNLGYQYLLAQVYDDSNILILPDAITLTDSNNLSIDLTSYGVLSGTWHAVMGV